MDKGTQVEGYRSKDEGGSKAAPKLMTKWKIIVSTSVVIESETPDGARREFEARRENCERSMSIEEDLLLNAEIVATTVYESPEMP